MHCYKDKTFCASPGCTNECGRRMSKEELKELEYLFERNWDCTVGTESQPATPVSYAYFCDHPNTQLTKEKNHGTHRE